MIGDDSHSKIEAGKVQTVGKFLGHTLSTRSASSEEQHLLLPCLKTDTHHHSGGNVIAKLLVALLGHSLYPQPPYSPDKRIRAAQIDAWIDYSTLYLRQVCSLCLELAFAYWNAHEQLHDSCSCIACLYAAQKQSQNFRKVTFLGSATSKHRHLFLLCCSNCIMHLQSCPALLSSLSQPCSSNIQVASPSLHAKAVGQAFMHQYNHWLHPKQGTYSGYSS